jgi:phosphatidylserine/phosphatidylglycerophosphate/cardiolipin synthase-like enzyme
VYNQELNAVIVNAEFASAMEKLYESDLSDAQEITIESWRNRSWRERAKDRFNDWIRRLL